MPSELLLLLHVATAMALGGLVGVERETAAKPAGLRTHMLVAGSDALLVGLGQIALNQYPDARTDGLVRADPIRIIVAVITGVSFLGAGTIIRGDRSVHGLTTAASLLMTSAMGVAVGLAQFVVACGTAVLMLVTLRAVPAIERLVRRRRRTGE
jgi:putative Mg2+ transporter-C (MgtC) family protein